MKKDLDTRRPDEAAPARESVPSDNNQFDEIVASFWGDIGKMNGQDHWEEPISHAALTVRTEGLARSVGERIFGKKIIDQKA